MASRRAPVRFSVFTEERADSASWKNREGFKSFRNFDVDGPDEEGSATAVTAQGYEMMTFVPTQVNPDGGATGSAANTMSLMIGTFPEAKGNIFWSVNNGDGTEGSKSVNVGREGDVTHIYQETWDSPARTNLTRNLKKQEEPPPEPTEPDFWYVPFEVGAFPNQERYGILALDKETLAVESEVLSIDASPEFPLDSYSYHSVIALCCDALGHMYFGVLQGQEGFPLEIYRCYSEVVDDSPTPAIVKVGEIPNVNSNTRVFPKACVPSLDVEAGGIYVNASDFSLGSDNFLEAVFHIDQDGITPVVGFISESSVITSEYGSNGEHLGFGTAAINYLGGMDRLLVTNGYGSQDWWELNKQVNLETGLIENDGIYTSDSSDPMAIVNPVVSAVAANRLARNGRIYATVSNVDFFPYPSWTDKTVVISVPSVMFPIVAVPTGDEYFLVFDNEVVPDSTDLDCAAFFTDGEGNHLVVGVNVGASPKATLFALYNSTTEAWSWGGAISGFDASGEAGDEFKFMGSVWSDDTHWYISGWRKANGDAAVCKISKADHESIDIITYAAYRNFCGINNNPIEVVVSLLGDQSGAYLRDVLLPLAGGE